MPLKNQDSYLEECLQSIEGQRFKDWELVVVDDHSKDNSRLKIGDWAKRDSRIRVFENKGTGLSDSLNLGIERAQADLIARMDADDVMTSDRLKKQFDFLKPTHSIVLGLLQVFLRPNQQLDLSSYLSYEDSAYA